MSPRVRRERWPSRFAYIVASVSAMVGLGSFLRLPGLCAEYGGITFFIPYFLLTVIMGYPMFTLESATGEMHRSGIVTFFNEVYQPFIGFGILQLTANIVSCAYYNIILGWFLVYTIRASYMPWKDDSQSYFDNFILNVDNDPYITVINILSCLMVWVVVFISIYRGVTYTAKVVFFTLPFPILMMIMLFLRSLTLKNGYATFAKSFYIDIPVLFMPRIWIEACGQVMISTSVGFGVACAYGSYRIKDGYLMQDAFIVHVIKLIVEIMSWITMVCIVGHVGWTEDQLSDYDGFQLAFVLYPKIAMSLPFESSWNFLFFMFLLTLGIDCSHASLEGIITCLVDSKKFGDNSRLHITLMTVLFGASLSVIMHLNLNVVESCDYFLTNFWFVLGSLGEVMVVSLFYNIASLYSKLGRGPVLMAHISWICAPVIGILLFTVTDHQCISILIGLFIWGFGSLVSVRLTDLEAPLKHKLYLLFLHQGRLLKHHYNETLHMEEQRYFKLNLYWYLSLKMIVMPLLITSVGASFISVFYLPMIRVNGALYASTGVIFVIIAIVLIMVPKYKKGIYDSLTPAPLDKEDEKVMHMDEWLRYWFRKEKKLLKVKK